MKLTKEDKQNALIKLHNFCKSYKKEQNCENQTCDNCPIPIITKLFINKGE